MDASLTTRQKEILDFIQRTLKAQGYPPTRAEICQHFGFRSPNAAEDHLRALARKGVVELRTGVSRGIHLPASAQLNPDGFPLVGRVAAGSPILAIENIEDHVELGVGLFATRPDYLLRVDGMSMRDAGILDGDLLAVQRSEVAEERQIVVVRVDDEVTVKRYHRRGTRVILSAENPDFKPLEFDLTKQEVAIEGRVVGVVRQQIVGNKESHIVQSD